VRLIVEIEAVSDQLLDFDVGGTFERTSAAGTAALPAFAAAIGTPAAIGPVPARSSIATALLAATLVAPALVPPGMLARATLGTIVAPLPLRLGSVLLTRLLVFLRSRGLRRGSLLSRSLSRGLCLRWHYFRLNFIFHVIFLEDWPLLCR
jgi:hypothetical protein